MCPICSTISDLTVCPVCGYDVTLDYGVYPTLMCNSAFAVSRSRALHKYAEASRERCEELEARVKRLEDRLDGILEALEKIKKHSVQTSSDEVAKSAHDESAPEPTKGVEKPEKGSAPLKPLSLKRGDRITIGKFKENDIEWVVLSANERTALLVCAEAIDVQAFNSTDSQCTWKDSSICKWLNGLFYRTAFSSAEHSMIELTHLSDVSANSNIFLLSAEEYIWYFNAKNSSDRDFFSGKCKPSAALAGTDPDTDWVGNIAWWLRSSGKPNDRAMCVDTTGKLVESGHSVYQYSHGIRPAMCIRLM